MKARSGLAIAGGSLLLSGCFTRDATSLANDERLARTGLAQGDRVMAHVVSYERCRVPDPVAEGDCEAQDLDAFGARIEACLAKQLPASVLVPAGENPAVGRPTQGSVRYVLALRARTSEGGFPTGGNSGLGWTIGRWEERTTRIDLEVRDPARSAPLGHVSAKAYGPSGRGVLFLLGIVPIPMVEDAPTEAEACKAMAKAVLKFLEDPEPQKWVPEPES